MPPSEPSVSAAPLDEDDEAARAYISRLWAEDWQSEEDAVYDDAT